MKHQFQIPGLAGALLLTFTGFALAQGQRPPRPDAPPAPAGVYTTVSGTITQFNYNRDAMVEGFLLNDRTLVHLPPDAASIIGPGLHANDAVEISGMGNTNPSGMRTIELRQMRDKTTGKTFAMPQPGAAAPYTGSGRIQQLNYGVDGSVNGFLLDNGTLAELPPFSAANPSSIRSGATVNFTGYARNTAAGHTVVNVQTLSMNGQTLTLASAETRRKQEAAPPAPPQSRRGAREGAAPPPPPPAAAGDGRTDEPAPPPQPNL